MKCFRIMKKQVCSISTGLFREDGQTTVEYAVVIGLILIGCVAAGSLVGEQVGSKTRTVSVALGGAAANASPIQSLSSVASIEDERLSTLLSFFIAFSSCALLTYILVRSRSKKPTKKPTKNKGVPESPENDLNRFNEVRRRIQTIFKSNRSQISTWTARVEHVMDRRYATVRADGRREEVAERLVGDSLGILVVLHNSGEVAGVIHEEDMATSDAPTADGIMRPVPKHLSPEMNLSAAIQFMHKNNLTWSPVLVGNSICGIVSNVDLMATLLCTLHLISDIDHEYQAVLRRATGMAEPVGPACELESI